jgi:hypothetical protein
MIDFIRRNPAWFLTIAILISIIAFGIGLFIKNWPLVKFDNETKITDLIGIILTITLAFLIPIFIKHYVDKRDKINDVILDEVERYREHLDITHNRFLEFYKGNIITSSNKDELVILCDLFDARIDLLKTVVNRKYELALKSKLIELSTKHIEYWKILTNETINSRTVNSIAQTTFQNEVQKHQDISEIITDIKIIVCEQ